LVVDGCMLMEIVYKVMIIMSCGLRRVFKEYGGVWFHPIQKYWSLVWTWSSTFHY